MTENSSKKLGGTVVTPKIATVIDLLEKEHGASLDDIASATGWQHHSIRAALTGLRKKGHAIERSKIDGVSRYTIARASAK